jgi:predicted nuclease of restriction endonuclease-like RecB superfamily
VLTADLVRSRRKGSELFVSELNAKTRERALALAQDYLSLAETHVGATRGELEEAWQGVSVPASERKLALGLRKLVEDRTAFDVQGEHDPRALRGELFRASSAARRALEEGADFARDAFLEQQASQRGMSVAELERIMYSDLRAAQILADFSAPTPAQLVDSYDLAQKQAVLLRAVSVVAQVRCRDPYAYRLLFRKLKFLRLMHRIEPRPDGYAIHIDGPFNLFSQSTKYGLELALALPALLSCDEYDIQARLRWGKEREELTFKLAGKSRASQREEPLVPDEVASFVTRFTALASPWRVELANDILDLPGVGTCMPDLRFVHGLTGEVAYLELLGYWSREALWRRVELAQRGLRERVIFAASSRLRVSEEVLDESSASQLYMFKGTLAPKEVLRRLSGEPGSQ